MSQAAAAFRMQLDLQTRLFNNVTEGLSDTEANTRNSDHINNIKWVMGHMLDTRLGSMCKHTGLPADNSYHAQFGRGATLDNSTVYPSVHEITERWNEVSPLLSEAIGKIPDDVFASKSPVQPPIADDTMLGMFAFLLSHEAYHLGQLGILRKLAGKEAMSFK
jgi:uncharacterized damage-inducible protein DinB